MVMSERRRLRALGRPQVLRLIRPACGHSSVTNALTSLVSGVIQKSANVVDEKRVERLRDLLLVGEIQRTIEWNPKGISTWEDIVR